MRKKIEITPEDFNGLLEYLSPDADEAAKKYEEIRARLIKFFRFRGCFDPEALADETFNRITVKLPDARFSEGFDFSCYFFSFAANIYHEDLRKRKKTVSIEGDVDSLFADKSNSVKEHGRVSMCLELCLLEHPPKERRLLLEYYSFGKSEHAGQRKRMAAEQNLSEQKLYAAISRVKKILRGCMNNCLNEREL